MKYLSILLFAVILISCNEKKKETIHVKSLTIAQKIANAHGFKNWQKVKQVEFTFKVDRDTIKGNGRKWTWLPKKDSVRLQAGVQDVKYSRANLDSVTLNADKAFINDKFWLLIPFQLVWDKGTTISEPIKTAAPISNQKLNKITILYSSKGGYTPGDAYDIYYSDDYLIREWVYREGNSETPTLTNIFETYKEFNGIKIATEHKKDNGNWNLNFTNVKVQLE